MFSGSATGSSTTVSLSLAAQSPFDGDGVLSFLGMRAIAGVETVIDGEYRRALRMPLGTASIALRLAGTAEHTTVDCTATLDDLSDLPALEAGLRRLLDLDADASAIDAALAADPILAPAVQAIPGIRVPGTMSPEETLFRALIGQQISVAAARTLLGRMAAHLGDRVSTAHGGGLLFPTAAQIAADGRAVLRGPAARIDTVMRVADALASGALHLDVEATADSLMAQLVAITGIGPWTAGYVAMRVLGSHDILLTTDLALRQGASRLGIASDAKALAVHGAAWAPWRSYAGMHLWRALSRPA